jgi:hypothetical protein
LLRKAGKGRGRGLRSGGARSARGEDVQLMPARCSTPCRHSEHGRERTNETKQSRSLAWVVSGKLRGGYWRGGSGKGALFEIETCHRPPRAWERVRGFRAS